MVTHGDPWAPLEAMPGYLMGYSGQSDKNTLLGLADNSGRSRGTQER